jgi:hypothetical protein
MAHGQQVACDDSLGQALTHLTESSTLARFELRLRESLVLIAPGIAHDLLLSVSEKASVARRSRSRLRRCARNDSVSRCLCEERSDEAIAVLRGRDGNLLLGMNTRAVHVPNVSSTPLGQPLPLCTIMVQTDTLV